MGLEGAVGLQESRFLQRVCSGLEASNLRFIGFYCGFGVCGFAVWSLLFWSSGVWGSGLRVWLREFRVACGFLDQLCRAFRVWV